MGNTSFDRRSRRCSVYHLLNTTELETTVELYKPIGAAVKLAFKNDPRNEITHIPANISSPFRDKPQLYRNSPRLLRYSLEHRGVKLRRTCKVIKTRHSLNPFPPVLVPLYVWRSRRFPSVNRREVPPESIRKELCLFTCCVNRRHSSIFCVLNFLGYDLTDFPYPKFHCTCISEF
jgi:hypothetical protein